MCSDVFSPAISRSRWPGRGSSRVTHDQFSRRFTRMTGAAGQGTGGGTIPDLSRVAFFDGERLVAEDLNAASALQREVRWLHNRSLHTWGIALGFAVNGDKGAQQVTVSPGYGIDSLGREVILTESLTK